MKTYEALWRIKVEAEFFRLALTCGLAGIKDVVGWADGLVEEGCREDAVFDLALAGNKIAGEVTRLLGTVPGQCELAYPVKPVLSHCHTQVEGKKKSPEKILAALGGIVGANRVPEPVKRYRLA